MPIYTAQVVIPNDNGIPADAVTNTFAFNIPDGVLPAWVITAGDIIPGGTDQENIAQAITQVLSDFYNALPDGAAQPINYFLSKFLNGANGTVKIVNRSDPKPRVPMAETPINIGTSTTGLPNEVAAVMSFEGAKESGVNQRRRRGRVFIGPLAQNAMADGSGGPVLNPALVQTLVTAGSALKRSSGNSWGVISTALGSTTSVVNGKERRTPGPDVFVPIATVWCDNAFDSQRRRGPRATARSVDRKLSTAALDLAA